MKDKEKTVMNPGKKISNLSLFVDDMMVYLKNPRKINLSVLFFSGLIF